MGYESDVICVFTKSGYEKFKENYVKKLEKEWENYPYKENSSIEDFEKDFIKPEEISPDGFVLWGNLRTKWYDDSEYYPDVKAFMQALNELDAKEYKFIRIGQESGDEEYLGALENEPFNVQYVRKFEYNRFRFKNDEDDEDDEETTRMDM